MDFDFKRRSRVCTRSERELVAGESYFSVLVEQDEEIMRYEIASSHWQGPPENCISWWRSKVPDHDPNRFFWAPDHVIIDYFESFQSVQGKLVAQFVLALLLIQKRIFRLRDTASDACGDEVMYVSCPRRGTNYEVPVQTPDPGEVDSIQSELTQLLFSDEPFNEELEDDVEQNQDSGLPENLTMKNEETGTGEELAEDLDADAEECLNREAMDAGNADQESTIKGKTS